MSVFAASLQITEVMYDPPGANSGHQWLEVTNLGTSTASLNGWRVSEGGTNHYIKVAQGTTTLPVGASLIVASNPADFLTDYPGYAGTLLKSAFSLTSKSGDTVSLMNAALEPVDTISYQPSAGASGDGNTLHRVGNTLVAGAPDPGIYTAVPPKPLEKPSAASGGTSAASKPAPTAAKTPASAATKSSASASVPVHSQAAALAAQPNRLVTWGMGALGAVLMGLAAALWVEPALFARRSKSGETAVEADEFEIE